MPLCPLADRCSDFGLNRYICKFGEMGTYKACGEYKKHVRSVDKDNERLSEAYRRGGHGHMGTGGGATQRPETELIPICKFHKKCKPSKQKIQQYCGSRKFQGSQYCGTYEMYANEEKGIKR